MSSLNSALYSLTAVAMPMYSYETCDQQEASSTLDGKSHA